ncbi:energy-coupling factor transporter ATPase [uncultured Selenomonas sp.]|uniref:energy-coupling factor transporter ATPase n=1 Tax=uncultured Selenomonas sp. TaxID=159275 RepID=UPI0025E99670|nr:energy-coupling factor transporter ATPase [uncultured Selenomonas sp.]
MALTELDRLSHVYHAGEENEHRALADVSLSIEAGEFVAVLGSNGSGKSTLAKHLDALLLPTSGVCRIDGMDTQNVDQVWRIRQKVGMVFQNPDNQLIAAIVEDDVAFGPENLGVPPKEIRSRVDEALSVVGMTKFRSFAPHLLSGGQKQRIAIAGALAMQTECLVFDEATAMLDPEGRAEILAVVKQLHKEQHKTIVYITHFMEEAAAADRIIVLDHGHLAMDGTPREVFAQVDELQKLGLDVPLSVELGARLRADGIDLPQAIVTEEDLVQALGAATGYAEEKGGAALGD